MNHRGVQLCAYMLNYLQPIRRLREYKEKIAKARPCKSGETSIMRDKEDERYHAYLNFYSLFLQHPSSYVLCEFYISMAYCQDVLISLSDIQAVLKPILTLSIVRVTS